MSHLERFIYDFCTDHTTVRRALGRSRSNQRVQTPSTRPKHPQPWKSPRSQSPNTRNESTSPEDPLRQLLDTHLRRRGFHVDYDSAAVALDKERTMELSHIRTQIQREREERRAHSHRGELRKQLAVLEEEELAGRRTVYRRFLQSMRVLKGERIEDALICLEDEEFSTRKDLLKHTLRRLDEAKTKEHKKRLRLQDKARRAARKQQEEETKRTQQDRPPQNTRVASSVPPPTFQSIPRVTLDVVRGVSSHPPVQTQAHKEGAPDEDDDPIFPQTISQKSRPEQVRFADERNDADNEEHSPIHDERNHNLGLLRRRTPSPPLQAESSTLSDPDHQEEEDYSFSHLHHREGSATSIDYLPADLGLDITNTEDVQRQFLKRMEAIERRVLVENSIIDIDQRNALVENNSISDSHSPEQHRLPPPVYHHSPPLSPLSRDDILKMNADDRSNSSISERGGGEASITSHVANYINDNEFTDVPSHRSPSVKSSTSTVSSFHHEPTPVRSHQSDGQIVASLVERAKSSSSPACRASPFQSAPTTPAQNPQNDNSPQSNPILALGGQSSIRRETYNQQGDDSNTPPQQERPPVTSAQRHSFSRSMRSNQSSPPDLDYHYGEEDVYGGASYDSVDMQPPALDASYDAALDLKRFQDPTPAESAAHSAYSVSPAMSATPPTPGPALGSRTSRPFLGLSLVEITGELNSEAGSSFHTASTSWTSSETADDSQLSGSRSVDDNSEIHRLGLVVNAKYIGGPGDVAGVELGDIVVGVAGKRVRMFEDVRKILLEQARLGESLPFHIVRPASSFDSPSRPARDPSARDVLIQVLTTDPDLRNQPRVFFDIECADRISRDGSVVKATKINSTVAPPQKH